MSSVLHPPTSSKVSSWGVAALSSESFWEPIVISPLFLTSRLFLCLWASFFTWPSALPLLSRRTGLVSHFRSVLPKKPKHTHKAQVKVNSPELQRTVKNSGFYLQLQLTASSLCSSVWNLKYFVLSFFKQIFFKAFQIKIGDLTWSFRPRGGVGADAVTGLQCSRGTWYDGVIAAHWQCVCEIQSCKWKQALWCQFQKWDQKQQLYSKKTRNNTVICKVKAYFLNIINFCRWQIRMWRPRKFILVEEHHLILNMMPAICSKKHLDTEETKCCSFLSEMLRKAQDFSC